jgi:hypothetical protein
MPSISGEIRDPLTGKTVEARVQVLAPNGQVLAPVNALFKVGPGEPFFYSDGRFSVETATSGYHRILVERGTEFRPWSRTVHTGATQPVTLDVSLERWTDLPARGWHPGNTHIHYDEKESRPDERLRYDSRVEDLRMTAISILKRWDLKYATNKFPIGMLNEYTDTHHYVQNGEESRHNSEPWKPGYGHIMLLNIRNIVEPLSRGVLVDAFDPDYPPLSYACDDTRRQGGIVIWCHNGQGMEAPVAAALGKVDAINLFDPHWSDPEYQLWYRMLNCGIRLPASTGSDWFVCSANRVYADTGGPFAYETWLQGLKSGQTFITNGPAISLSVNGQPPGSTVQASPGQHLEVEVTWSSHYAVESVEVVANGKAVASQSPAADGRARRPGPRAVRAQGSGRRRGDESPFRPNDQADGPSSSGAMRTSVEVQSSGWIGARLGSTQRDSFNQCIWAHTSPVYIDAGRSRGHAGAESAAWFVDAIDQSLDWVRAKGRFYSDAQRKEVQDLFRQGQEYYKRLQFGSGTIDLKPLSR